MTPNISLSTDVNMIIKYMQLILCGGKQNNRDNSKIMIIVGKSGMRGKTLADKVNPNCVHFGILDFTATQYL